MPQNRYFLDAIFHQDSHVLLEGEEAHHLSRVMRKEKGDPIELVNGKGQLATASIEAIEKNRVHIIIRTLFEPKPPKRRVIICQALPRFNRLETIVEKGTELGMYALWLYPGALSEKKDLSNSQLCRLKAIAIASMKQSGRLDLPLISLHPSLEKWSKLDFPAFFGDLEPEAPSLLSALKGNISDDLLFFVGPESGFTPKEKEQLKNIHAFGVRLHINTLRTDTAPLAALSIISNAFLSNF